MSLLESDSYDIEDDFVKIDVSDYHGNIQKLKDQVQSDKKDLSEIISLIKDIDNEKDVKLQTFINHIRLSQSKNSRPKLLIFTQFKDTARYLYENLSKYNFGEVSEIDSKNNQNNRKEKVVAQFSPKANPDFFDSNKPEIDILISTDILSEGQNLQDCNTIINYDLTWNPVRIIQREGRIDRITTQHDNVYIYNFIPDDKLDALLNLTKRLAKKIRYINETIGNESQIISDDEVLIDKVFNEKDQRHLKMVNMEDVTVLDELEQDRDDFIPSEEYIYEDYKELLFNNEKNMTLASNIPDGIFSIRKSDENKGIFMYYKSGGNNYWLFYDIKSNKFKTSKAEIYKIISNGNYLNVRPLKRKINFNVEEILELGEKHVTDQLRDIAQIKATSSEIDIVQKNIAERLENIFSKAKFRNKITLEQRMIRKKLKKPLHRGTINKLKSINFPSMTDNELISKLDDLLEYINVKDVNNTNNDDSGIRLVCYEIFI
nr:helicase-related protein [Halobacillus sp. A1]